MVHGVFLNLIQPTICIAPWKVFLESGITRLPIRPCFTIPAATAVAVRQSSATISLRVSLFLFGSSFAARISLS